ncbi:MAG TPA: chlorite dismutase family protein [Candidatus Limnocylindria bacterium]|nr:chlorite dismutase family protein [Candidatus Limnocylindria bacterium]
MSTGGEGPIDVRERGANQQLSDRRLYMQLQVLTGATDSKPLVGALETSGLEAVLYEDVNDPRGVGVLTMSEDPALFVTGVRELLNRGPFAGLALRPELTMMGRTYASGFEADLDEWLLRRPRRTALNPAWPWGIWYPLRRTGAFARLDAREQGQVIREHSVIGRAYGDADLAHDVRLACQGLDMHDNDFVIGLVGKDLHPLSHLVQTMRKTVQTSQYLQSLGPFFIGRVLWQSG